MNINHVLILLTLIFSFSNCNYLSEEVFKEISFMTPTKFSIDDKNKALFKYKLVDDGKGTVGLKFLKANSYTVNVTTYSSYEKKENEIQYSLAEEQFKEINVTKYDEYLYIVIKITKTNYTYDDYLTIYDSAKEIKLEHNKPISINNFLSNQQYTLTYKTDKSKTIDLYYNTRNYDKNKRSISIDCDDIHIIAYEEIESLHQNREIDENKVLKVYIKNDYVKTKENENQRQEFTLMIRELENEKNFNKIQINKPETFNYIYSNESQIFYFYVNITNMKEQNTLNLKLDYKYYKKDKINVLAKYVPLDKDIQTEDFDDYKPVKNELINSYDIYSDEYLRIYLNNKNNNQQSNFLYVFASVEIKNEPYYYGSKSLEISIGEEEKIEDFTNINYNIAQKIEKETLYYIPYYWKLKLNKDDVYLLGIYNEHIFVSTFIRGDLTLANNSINYDVLESNNEIIVLSNIDIFTIKLFGIKKKVEVYIERIKKDEIQYMQEIRTKNHIFTLNMTKGQTKYILGTYSYDDYAFGKLSEKYYATKDKGDFELLFYNDVGSDENNLFPKDPKYSKKFNEIIDLKTHLDLFTIKCISDGIMSIRPQYKHFDETVHLVEQNSFKTVTMGELIEVIQLAAPLGNRNETLYFTIKILNSKQSLSQANNNLKDEVISLAIKPDTEGAFENGTIKGNEIFFGKIDLNKFKPDQLAIRLNSTYFGTELEIVEAIYNNYTSYKKVGQGENNNIESYNVYLPISNNESLVIIKIDNLIGKTISYVIIRSEINDSNYLTTADSYPGKNHANINNNTFTIHKINEYCNKTDSLKPYVYLLFSVNGTEDNLKYNLNISYSDPPIPNNKAKNAIIIVVSVIGFLAILIILFGVITHRRRQSSSEIEKLEPINLNENQLT